MREHSELPWVAIEGDTLNPERPWGVSCYLSREACEEIDGEDATWPSRTEVIAEVCDGEPGIAEADARFIVRACNSHDELLAACKAFVDDFIGYINSDDYDLPDPTALKAAIAKAEAE